VKRPLQEICALAVPLLLAAPAAAQVPLAGQSVAARVPKGYEPYPHPLGSFNLFPSLRADFNATDNFRASSVNRLSDFYVVVTPQLSARSNWSRHRLNASAFVSRSQHANLTSENVTEFGAEADSIIEASRATRILLSGQADQRVENRANLGAQQGLPVPVTFRQLRGSAGVTHDANQLSLNASVAASRLDFSNPTTASGIVVDQSFRDETTYSVALGAGYDLRSGVSLVVQGQFTDHQFPFGPGSPGFDPRFSIDRDSRGFKIDGGVTLELSSLISGTVRVGVLDRRYVDPRLKDVSGFSYSVDLLWNVTPLTSLQLRAARSIEDTASTIVAGNTRDEVQLVVEHELYRNLLLTATTRYAEFSPNGPGAGGQEFAAGLSGRYRVDRHWSIDGRLNYNERSSANPIIAFNATSGQIGVAYAF
jgi:hypothetical protein